MGYLSLFLVAFAAATILPLSSEALLIALAQQDYIIWLLVVIATAGNTLGSVVNWHLGKYLLNFQHKKWFYFKQIQIEKAQQRFNRYGVYSLFFAWLPVIGDVLTLIAGVMKVKLRLFIPIVALGKALRYLSVLYVANFFIV